MTKIDCDKHSQAIQTHLGILQGITSRMAANCNSSKAFCVTLVSAILVIVADKGKPDYALIAVIPILLFYFLDAYYLGLEREFRDKYIAFVRKYHKDDLVIEDMYDVSPPKGVSVLKVEAFVSWAVLPFYGVLLLMVVLAKSIVIPVAK